MRRDHFTLSIDDTDADAGDTPSLVLGYDGPAEPLASRLTDNGDHLDGDDVDASFRLRDADSIEVSGATGVFSLTRRLTGEYLFEVTTDAKKVRTLVDAARAQGGTYDIHIEPSDADSVVLETETLLVYDADGNLLRKDSLIPSGVEL
jgi:glycine cleavage system aminomethyltransferase T